MRRTPARCVALAAVVLGALPLACTAFTGDAEEQVAAPAAGGPEGGGIQGPLEAGAPVADGGALVEGGGVHDAEAQAVEVLRLPLDTPDACNLLTSFGGAAPASSLAGAYLGSGCRVCVTAATTKFGVTVSFPAPGDVTLALSAQVRTTPGTVAPTGFAAALLGPNDAPPAPPVGTLPGEWTPATVTRATNAPQPFSAALIGSAPTLTAGTQTCFDVDEIFVRASP